MLNRMLRAIFREATWLLDMGVASVEDIDKACVFRAGHPMGPFRLNDLRIEDEINVPSCLSFVPSSALRERTNTMSMRPFTRLEDEPKSCAIWDIYFILDPKGFGTFSERLHTDRTAHGKHAP